MQSFDVIVVGGGHNGLVAAGYLSQAGLRVLVVEGRAQLGGPVARVEFMPGYKTTITNSPGSLEPRIVRDLALERHGLRFVKADPTLVHPLEDGRLFVAWRDKRRTQRQLEAFAPGEVARYEAMHVYLQQFADKLGISLFREPPSLPELVRNLTTPADQEAFARVFFGSARELMEEFNLAPETQAILAPLTVVAGQVAPSTPGTPFNMLFRPLSLASVGGEAGYDPRRQYLRGSTGQPIGGMAKIIEAMTASAQARGATLRTETPVARVLTRDGAVRGIVTADGEEIAAPIVISAINPRLTALELMQDDADWREIRGKMARRRMRGRAFKLVLALDGLPRYAAAADDAEARKLAGAQFRIAPSIDYVEEAHTDMMLGRISDKPMIWGLCPSVVSPELAPPGCHILSLNIGTAPYKLREGDWASARDKLAKLCIDALSRWMPTLPDIISDYRCLDPTDFEREYGLVEGNITHGDIVPWNQLWMRPLPGLHDYRTPTRGLYLSGNGTWPGNFVSGIAGHNTSHAVLADLKSGRIGTEQPPRVAAVT